MSEEEETPMFQSVLMMPKKRAGPITDIMLWSQCFANYVAIISSKFPSATPELLSYMAMIIKCARDYEGIAWVQYDRISGRLSAKGRTCAGHTSIRQCIRCVSIVGIEDAWCVLTACLIRTHQLSAQKCRISDSGSGGNNRSV